MGSDAEVYLFDYLRYRDEVVPALHQLLRGTVVPLLHNLIERFPDWWDLPDEQFRTHVRYYPTELIGICSYLTRDFAFIGSVEDKDCWVGWEKRACSSTSCPQRQHCPLHASQKGGLFEEFRILFESVVSATCLGEGQFVGRTMNTFGYYDVLEHFQIPANHPIRPLLNALESRGFVVGYGLGGIGGIHGWLTPTETKELAEHLTSLPLPQYEASFAAMRSFEDAHGRYKHPTAPFGELSLSFVRTVATIASTQHQSILWGNDVYGPDIFQELQTLP